MDRRNFLKGAVLMVGLKSAPKFKPSKPVKSIDFKPDEEYGNVVSAFNADTKDPDVWDELKRVAYNDMLKVVPAKWRYRVQFRTKIMDYERIPSLAWYYPPSGKHHVHCNGRYICDSTKYLPLPVQNKLVGYGII